MAGKEIKLDATSEILVADSDWESDAEASNVDYFEGEVEQQKQQLQASANSNHRLQQGLPQKRNTNIHPSLCPAKCGP